MKQQKPSHNRPKAKVEWPAHPQSPHLKTIGGEADKAAIDSHNTDTREWYHSFQGKLDDMVEELRGEIRDLQARVSVLEKNAGP